jgi:hypothetical protein
MESDLCFASNEDLIMELMERKTFVGVVVMSKDEHRTPEQEHGDFVTYTSLPDRENMIELMEAVLGGLREK